MTNLTVFQELSDAKCGSRIAEPHSLRGIMIGLILVARPAMASG